MLLQMMYLQTFSVTMWIQIYVLSRCFESQILVEFEGAEAVDNSPPPSAHHLSHYCEISEISLSSPFSTILFVTENNRANN